MSAPPAPPKPRIASPCISVCRRDPFEDLCLGCMRTTAEIEAWVRMGDDERRRIMDTLAARRSQRRARPRGP